MSSAMDELRDSARQVMAGQGLAADEASSWAQIAELGWLMVTTPEEAGGLGMGLEGACALSLELGRGLATVPFSPATVAIEAINHSHLPEGQLEGLLAGTEYHAAPLGACTLGLARDSRTLAGTARAVPSADRADRLLLWTRERDCVALVAPDKMGVTVDFHKTWDETRRLFDVHCEGVVLEDREILASGADAKQLVGRLAVLRDYLLAAESIGAAAALLEMTVEYLGTREQFGRPLALFQALKHRCADLKAVTEAAEALLLDKLSKCGDEFAEFGATPAVTQGAAAVKQLANEAFVQVAEEALQLHGGIGMTSEHDCHLFLKRAMLDEHLGEERDHYPLALAAGYFPLEN